MRIALTGGHFSPAYTVIKKLKAMDEILVIGRKYAFEGDTNETFEYKVCKEEGINFKVLNAGRLQRKFTKYTIPSAIKFPMGIYHAIKILKEFSPDVVVTFGGYVGLPVSYAAKILNIPVILHEQTQNAGLSAKLISRIAHVVCVSFESSKRVFKSKNVLLTGNPLREEIFMKQEFNYPKDKPIIYITGGSTGSHIINETVYEILPELLKDYIIIHQVGNSQGGQDMLKAQNLQMRLPKDIERNYIPKQFFSPSEVASFFQNADLVVGRSGINTILELMATGTVSLFIPLPFGQQDEQTQNALLFKKSGLGDIINQKDLTPDLLLSKMRAMIKEQTKYKENATNVGMYVYPQAAEKIVQQIYYYGKRGQEKRKISATQ